MHLDPTALRSLLPRPDPADQAILSVASDLYGNQVDQRLTRDSLRRINESYGTDVATALLYLHFDRQPMKLQPGGPTSNTPSRTIAIIPGAFYREHPEIGGDGKPIAELAARNAWPCRMIPTASLGTLDENAQIICQFFREQPADQRLIVATLSKGTLDLAAAIRRDPTIAEQISGWVSISPVVSGTMMADWLLDRWRLRPVLRLMQWRHGAERQAVRDLRHRPPSDHTSFSHIPLFHIAGFPLERHLSSWRARLWHRRFRSFGPNDSVVLLEDLLEFPGMVLPVWGVDHYLKSDWDPTSLIETIVTEGLKPTSHQGLAPSLPSRCVQP